MLKVKLVQLFANFAKASFAGLIRRDSLYQISFSKIWPEGRREIAFAIGQLPKRKIADPRWRIEHSQIVNPSDIPRFKQLGIIPSMQPSHAIGDLHFAPSRLGLERLQGAYAWNTFIKS